jgi:hypothetical protein
MDKEIDAVAFDFVDDGCAEYYDTPVELQWDLDINGTFESTGSPVIFSALAFDGPTTVQVPARAQHPFGGPPGETFATVIVRNVAPEISPFRVSDSGGNEVNVDVPFVLTGLPVTVSAGFTDPGVLDHQAAALNWGDGAIDTQAVFDLFDDAFGDAVGELSHSHAYSLSGTFTIGLAVADDDGGMDSASADVRVLTPEEAVEELIDMLDDLIAGTGDSRVRGDLEKARMALTGSHNHSNNGALEKIRDGHDQATIAFLRQAIFWLQRAQQGGADVATLIALLEQVIVALSQA